MRKITEILKNKMATSYVKEAELLSFFIYNPTLGLKEGTVRTALRNPHTPSEVSALLQEEQKILYYYPEHEATNRKVRNIGLCEAMVNFTKTFHPDRPCQAVHTDRKRQVFLEPEPNIWTVLVSGSDSLLSLCLIVCCVEDCEHSVGGAGQQWRENGAVHSGTCASKCYSLS